jgi:tRNA A-37 threonylcarbamoyl transferase component Bud32
VPECPTCGKHLEAGVRFCPDDGTPLTETAAITAAAHTPTGKRPITRELELPTVLGGRYRLTQFMGGGGMAKVYKAIDITLEREVAVKLINPELRAEPEFDARFQREARIASQLSDPHIVVVHDFGLDPTHGPFLVMEYLQGMSLRDRIKTQGPMPYRAAVQLSAQILLALIHAHEKGIVHRDIKPDNIFLLNQSGVRLHVRVLDFGIARIYKRDEPSAAESLTRPGAVLGTPRYMSPEQLAGQSLDARSDLYSAAMVIHEAATGHLPHLSGKKLTEMCPEAPPAFEQLLNHCLQPNPAERPANAVEVYLRLQDLGKASGILLLPPGALEKLSKSRKSTEPTVDYVPAGRWKRRAFLALAVAAVLALLGGGAWGLYKWLRPPSVTSGPESLLGVMVGQSRDLVSQKVSQVVGKAPVPLAHGQALQGDDLLEALASRLGAGPAPDVLPWPDQHVKAVVRDETLLALVVRSPQPAARSARGVQLEDPAEAVVHHYGSVATHKGSRGLIYCYDDVGIAFEVVNNRVKAMAIYPPGPAGEK